LSLWLREIELSPEQITALKDKQRSGLSERKANQEKKIRRTKEIIGKAKKEVKHLFKNLLFLAGLMLCWTEG